MPYVISNLAVQDPDPCAPRRDEGRRLPEPARRWLERSIRTGTAGYTRVHLELEGHIKLGSWHRFTARQTIRPRHGYTWRGRTNIAGVPMDGLETMTPSVARRLWRAARLVSVLRSDGPDELNSAAGRLAAESVFVPTTFGLVTWEAAADPDSVFATWRIGSRVDRIRLEVAPSGRLQSVSLRRWGTPPGGRYGRHPFGLHFEEEITVDGVTLPRTMTASWLWGSDRQRDGAIMRAQVVGVRFA